VTDRVLVTGGAGFVGSHLCRRLLREGREVVCLDDLSTGSEANIAGLRKEPKFTFVKGDVVEGVDLEVGQIYNLACPASPPAYQADPIRTFRASVWGAFNMLELAARKGATILQASTSEVYGDPLVHPQTEAYWGNVNPIGLRSCYDEGKRGAETLCFDHWRSHSTKIKVIRIFNTYGPSMDPEDGRVVSNFIVQALKGRPLTIYGDGSQTRSFCYVDDLVEGMTKMMNSTEGIRGPINLGNPGEFTIAELAEKVKRLTGSDSEIVFRPLPSDDPKLRKPDISLAVRHLGWEPKVELEEGLLSTIAYFRAIHRDGRQCTGGKS
jgi:UDP-glucuronate decarboxylase